MTRFLTKIMKIAKEVHGEDNISIILMGRPDTKYLDIRWPELTISNRSRVSHLLRGMHVSLPLQQDDKGFRGRIHGWRDTLTYVENRSGYAHSHLPGTLFSSFCTGMDGINDLWASLQTGATATDQWAESFRGFLFFLESYMAYESLEGVPHRRIARIGMGNNNNVAHHVGVSQASRMLKEVPKEFIKLSIDFNSRSVELVETDELHDFLVKMSSVQAFRLPNGTYQGMQRIELTEQVVLEGSSATGRAPRTEEGVQLTVTILAHSKREKVSASAKKFTHPDIFIHFKQTIEDYAKSSIIQSAIREFEQASGSEHKALHQNKEAWEINPDRKFSSSNFALSYKASGEGMVWVPTLDIPQENESEETGDSNVNGDVLQVAELG